MEIDHIFICVRPGAPEAEVLKEFGLTEGSPNKHPGQGTANRRFFFHNAFIELLWLEDPREAQSEVTRPTMLYERLSAESEEISPFGLCFRPTSSNGEKAPFSTWSYKPSYLPTGFEIAIAEGAPLSEPMWFFLSFASRPDIAPKEKQPPLLHRIGLMEVTSVWISLPKSKQLSAPAICAVQSRSMSVVEGPTHFLEIGFNHEVKGCSHDFRPILPLGFRW
jgi:Glyoxalase-like domain